MPTLEKYFLYRNFDVSTIKEFARRWAPKVAAGFSKDFTHLVLDDIRDSINELRYYREKLFNARVISSS
jgi:Oligoribonuclease (3''->5'' exoribonuclease)